MTRCRTNFHTESEAMINKQINMELHASYVYLSMVSTIFLIIELHFNLWFKFGPWKCLVKVNANIGAFLHFMMEKAVILFQLWRMFLSSFWFDIRNL